MTLKGLQGPCQTVNMATAEPRWRAHTLRRLGRFQTPKKSISWPLPDEGTSFAIPDTIHELEKVLGVVEHNRLTKLETPPDYFRLAKTFRRKEKQEAAAEAPPSLTAEQQELMRRNREQAKARQQQRREQRDVLDETQKQTIERNRQEALERKRRKKEEKQQTQVAQAAEALVVTPTGFILASDYEEDFVRDALGKEPEQYWAEVAGRAEADLRGNWRIARDMADDEHKMRAAQARQTQLKDFLDAARQPGEGTAGGLVAGPCGPERENQGLSGDATHTPRTQCSGAARLARPKGLAAGRPRAFSSRATETDPRRVEDGAERCGQTSHWTEQAGGSADPVVYAERTAEAEGTLRSENVTPHAEESQPRKRAKTRRGGLDDSEPDDIDEEEATGAAKRFEGLPQPTAEPRADDSHVKLTKAQQAMARLRERVRLRHSKADAGLPHAVAQKKDCRDGQ